jgi:hypothetical protein
MRRLAIAGLIAASALGTLVLGASAQTQKYRATWWPPIVSTGSTVSESYSDIPWHQKLGTFAGNELDEAIVLPYAALPTANTDWCTGRNLGQARCMIETGINSIITVARTDTLYDWVGTGDPKKLIQNAKRCDVPSPNAGPPRCNRVIPYCDNPSTPGSVPCIEVNLEISMYWSRGSNALVPRPYGNENKKNQNPPVYDSGLVFTDGTVFAPQMPWYMSHYCFSKTAGPANTVCDDDYFTTINNGYNVTQGGDGNNGGWPNANAPWSVYPNAASQQGGPGLTGPNHCAQTDPSGLQLTKCTMVLAGFDLYSVTGPQVYNGQFQGYNATLFDDLPNGVGQLGWFNTALKNFPTDLGQDVEHHFPWLDTQLSWAKQVYPQAILSPFQGQYAITTAGGPTPADHYLYPRKCTLDDLYALSAPKLRQCGVVYELHPNGWSTQWPASYQTYIGPQGANMLGPNQYGRTSFLFAGVPGMQMPVSFYQDPTRCPELCASGNLSIYEQVHNASLFSLYLPIANEADIKWAETGRNYTDKEFYHTLLMTNHMEQDPDTFADGIRGRTLWHNEYRSQVMYDPAVRNKFPSAFPDVMFPAAVQTPGKAPWHNSTCDGCHVRNGSGIPINPLGKLDPVLQGPAKCAPNVSCFMTAGVYTPYKVKDYTFTGVIDPMKLVFFDLNRVTSRNDPSVYSRPEEGGKVAAWANKIMNFYGDSFHVTDPNFTYSWSYGTADANRLVVSTARVNSELNYTYVPQQVNLGTFTPFKTSPCKDGQGGTIVLPTPRDSLKAYWPQSCAEIDGAAVTAATKDGGNVGFMLLNGKRLGNLGAIEAMPNGAIQFIQQNQINVLGSVSMINGMPISPPIPRYGQILWTAGTRGGVGRTNVPVPGPDQKLNCTTQTSLTNCWIGRFGWLGDRVSLEDQVANAAFIEMNMTTSQGYTALYGNTPVQFPVRYNLPNCGPANQSCVNSKGNGELLETDINRMADYARWLGDPTRSEFTVSLPEVIAGEKIFRQLNCNQCHVIGKIPIANSNDTMLTPVYRDRLTTHVSSSGNPYLSYLGTDLLMHDMGYLSQVGVRSAGIRDTVSGVVLPGFENYVQKIRTPALKGLRFNRFVTESHNNTVSATSPACDFLLHDGRACDAIEAAFLHDGPAIKALNVIGAKGKGGLNDLSPLQIQQLRAFLYSL